MKLLVYAFPCKPIQTVVVENYDPYCENENNCNEIARNNIPAISDFAKYARTINDTHGQMEEIIVFGPYTYAEKFKEYLEEGCPEQKVRIVSPKRGN